MAVVVWHSSLKFTLKLYKVLYFKQILFFFLHFVTQLILDSFVKLFF
jgi:hypothetical protein